MEKEGERERGKSSSTDAAEKFLTPFFYLFLSFFLDEIGFPVEGKMEGTFLLEGVRIKFIQAELRAFHGLWSYGARGKD